MQVCKTLCSSALVAKSVTEMKRLSFKGFMVPVFTIFNDDELQTVNYETIDPYADYLKRSGLGAVLVHGTTGEGTSLTCREREISIEKWSEACQRHDLTLMVQVAGTSFNEVVQLAKHSEKWNVDALLLLPELYFKPYNIQELVKYIKEVALHVPNMPIFYYHIPMLTGLMFDMSDFMDLAEKEIPNFQGIKYTSDDLDALPISALTPKRTIFIGSDLKCLDALRRGFDSFIMTTLNLRPEIALKMQKSPHSEESNLDQKILSDFVKAVLVNGGANWVVSMKKEFNNSAPPFTVGLPRKPLYM